MRPFPWQHLERIEREDLSRCRQLRGLLGNEATKAFQRWATRCFSAAKVQLHGVVDAIPSQAPSVRLALAGPRGAQAVLVVGAKLVSAITSKLLATEPAPLIGPPSPTEKGLVAYAASWLLSEMPGCAWSVDIDADDSVTAETIIVFEAKVSLDGQSGLVWLAVGREVLFNAPSAAIRNSGLIERMSIQASIVGGRFALALDDIETLTAGDLILSPECPPMTGEMRAWLDVGSGAFPVVIARRGRTEATAEGSGPAERPTVIEEQNVRVSGPFGVGAEAMRADQERETIADHVAVDVVVEMGRVRMSGAEIMSLGQGDVITLERPVGSDVVLKAGGRLLARGELVDVEGEAGVRLTEIVG